MNNIKALLEKRSQMKKKKPLFIRKDIYKKSKLGKSWRKPRGLDNKQRLCKKGPAKKISNGYRAPREIRGFHKSGLVPVVVSNVSQLNSLTKEQGVIVSAKLGNRKRLALINEAKKRGLVMLNFDADKILVKIQTDLKQRQERKKRFGQEKEEKVKKKSIEEKVKKEELKKEEPKKEEPQLSDEEKKKLEKEEKDKLLIKRE